MLYSQALTGGQHQAASTSSSTTPTSPKTAKTHPETTTSAARPPRETTTKQHQKAPRSRRHNQHQPLQQSPYPDHIPNTPNHPTNHNPQETQDQVYILTLTTTPSLTTPLTALRRRHFPAQRDRGNLPAHLTMFHALPGSEMETGLIPALEEVVCGGQQGGPGQPGQPQPRQEKKGPTLKLATGKVFRMRRGVGIELARDGEAAAARRLHADLQRRWWDFLSEQDRQPWRPHWTVQNKAADDAAVDAAMQDVRASFRGAEGLATGCTLWRYEKGGRWTFERRFDFSGER